MNTVFKQKLKENTYKAANIHNCKVQTKLECAKIGKEEDSLKLGSVEYNKMPRLFDRNDINQIQLPYKEIQLARILDLDSLKTNHAQMDHNQNALQNKAGGVINHVSFIKHKTESGAIHNVLVRLALRHNLTVALPSCRSELKNYQIFPAVAKLQFILNKPPLHNYHEYNIFVDHALFDRNSQLDPNTIYILKL